MSENKFEEFRQLVLLEESLQKELRGLTDRKEFVNRMVELGAAHGYQFTAQDVEEALRGAHRIGT
jgi:hypothetical protein